MTREELSKWIEAVCVIAGLIAVWFILASPGDL